MQKKSLDTEINDTGSSFLDTEDFVPIDPDWRKKYYLRIFKKRVVAFLLDIFFSGMICFITIILFLFVVFFLIKIIKPNWSDLQFNSWSDKNFPLLCYLSLGSTFLPLAIMESSKWKGTVGKRIMKIQITDNYGNPISFWRALWRNILKVLVFFSYFLIIPAMIQYFAFKKSRKFFHDSFSKTIIGERL